MSILGLGWGGHNIIRIIDTTMIAYMIISLKIIKL
jgi:hypothetical protein